MMNRLGQFIIQLVKNMQNVLLLKVKFQRDMVKISDYYALVHLFNDIYLYISIIIIIMLQFYLIFNIKKNIKIQ